MSSLDQPNHPKQPEQPNLDEPDRLPLVALLTANAISWHGTAITQIAVPWFVLHTTGSPALTGVIATSSVVGSLVSFLLGAGLVDRLGYRRASVLADALSAAAVALIPALHHAGQLTIPLLAALAFTRALLDGPGSTARASLLPDLAVRARTSLAHANTLGEVAESGAGWTGPLLAGVLIAAVGAQAVLWLDAASFLLSAVLLRAFVPPTAPTRTTDGREDAALLGGWRFLWQDGPLRVIFASSVVFSALMAALFAVVLPVYARDAGGPVALGGLVSAFGVGAVLGALAFGRFGTRWSRRRVFLVGNAGLCGIFAALAALPVLPVALAACFLGGLVAGPNGPMIPTLLQERTPAHLRARVIAASNVLTLSAAPLGVLVGGVMLERAGFTSALISMTALFALGGAYAALAPGLRDADTEPTR